MNHFNLHIKCTLNNIILNLTNKNGDSIYLISSGFLDFKTTKKTTFYSAKVCLEKVLEKLNVIKPKPKSINIYLKGINYGRKAIIKDLKLIKWPVNLITDSTPIPFNGCRPKKQRRI